ncbi:MAG: hypothetical protein IPM57_03430 [Oligoflexia bacterium]|nr:hypothetical protein [Oligoflexia bacterium]
MFFSFLLLTSFGAFSEDTIPVGDAAQETVVATGSTYVTGGGLGNVGASCMHSTSSCTGLDKGSCRGSFTLEDKEAFEAAAEGTSSTK